MMAVVMIKMKIIMKKTSNYYKRKKTAIFRLLTESNNFFITPTIRVYFDRAYAGCYDRIYLELSWFNRTLAIKIK
jgi:hypothetical protein